jgi:hypothetical protein
VLAHARRPGAQIGGTTLSFLGTLLKAQIDSVVMAVPHDGTQSAMELQVLLTRLGPTFVKVAQFFSMRADLIGEQYADVLSDLQARPAAAPSSGARAPCGQAWVLTSPACAFLPARCRTACRRLTAPRRCSSWRRS